MRLPPIPHRWRLSPRRAIAIQRRLAAQVQCVRPPHPLRFVGGLDAAISLDGCTCLAAVVLWDADNLTTVEEHVAMRPLLFPYIPGLLSFREAPALLAALRQLRRRPDVLMCDGQGLAHPRRFGIACHLGVLCDLPAIGCAKSRLIGEPASPGRTRGNTVPLTDRGERVGEVVRTQTNLKPVYVSVGHRLDQESARALVLRCATDYRLPEPTRLADRLVARLRRDEGPGDSTDGRGCATGEGQDSLANPDRHGGGGSSEFSADFVGFRACLFACRPFDLRT
jgi:deoxyribonuclease V